MAEVAYSWSKLETGKAKYREQIYRASRVLIHAEINLAVLEILQEAGGGLIGLELAEKVNERIEHSGYSALSLCEILQVNPDKLVCLG